MRALDDFVDRGRAKETKKSPCQSREVERLGGFLMLLSCCISYGWLGDLQQSGSLCDEQHFLVGGLYCGFTEMTDLILLFHQVEIRLNVPSIYMSSSTRDC